MYSLLALLLVGLVYGLTEQEYQQAFDDFKVTYGKAYLPEEEAHRYSVFKFNLDFVNNWDKNARGFEVAINKFADLTAEEMGALYRGTRINKVPSDIEVALNPSIPTSVDWRTKGYVTPIKDQGQCGSCWSFSTTGSTEGAHFKKTGKLVSLSEQNLVDCSGAEGNQGCNGGLMDSAFQYIINNKGIDTEASYPYTARDGTCHYNSANSGATIASFKDVTSGSETALANEVADIGPVSVAIDASHTSFQLYKSGVYYEPACSATALDHGVLAVGYEADSWIVKNSWGTGWGTNGYINMSRGRNNNCGIATMASYPIA